MNFSFLPYDPIFPKLFAKEKSYLQQIIGKDTVIEHFGSTSVQGLGGKGVIDIYIQVPINKIKSISGILQQNGYVFRDYFKDEDHFLYQINRAEGNKKYHYHIHLSSLGNNNFKDCIAFRDYLRAHPNACKKYAQVKQKATKLIKNIRDKKILKKLYIKTKESGIQEIMKKVKKL